jgi:hypothetical protein
MYLYLMFFAKSPLELAAGRIVTTLSALGKPAR